jgi:hypothetical protein
MSYVAANRTHMTSKERRAYIRALSGVNSSFVVASLSMPSIHMRPVHLMLHRLVLRRRGLGDNGKAL